MTSYYDQVSSSGPKVWYRFNETSGTPDNSGSLSTTTSFVDYTLNQSTVIDGKSVSLNGTSSYAQLPAHSANALFDDKSFTVEAWVKIATADTNRSAPLEIFRLNPASSPHTTISLVVDGTAGTRGKAKLSSHWTTDILSTNRIDDGLWHHVVYTYNTSSVKLYIDGTLNSSTTPSGLPTSFSFDTSGKKLIGAGYVGISQASRGQYFKGNIDEFAAYDYELTSTTILANYTAGTSRDIAASPATASATAPEPLAVYDVLYNLAVNDGAAYIYKFNSTLTDVYSNSSGHTFTATNSGYSYKPGETPSITGGSWYPTTTTPNLAFGESATPLFNNMKGMTLEFVFYLDSQVTDSNYKTLFIKEFGGQYYAVALNPGSTGNVLQVQINNTDYYTFNSTEMAVDQWHHVVFEWGAKDNYLTAYINGTKSQSTSTYASSQNNFRDNYNISLGARDVWIDFLAIYATDYNANSYLTDADVTIHKTAMLSGITDMYNPFQYPVPATASALIPNPVINISFNPEQGVATASAAMVNPYAILITSQAGVMTASAEILLPQGLGDVTYSVLAVTAFASIEHPSITAIRNVNYSSGALSASATAPNAEWAHDSGLSATHMVATALLREPEVYIAGLVRANADIANATMIHPTISTAQNGLVKPQSLNANAFMVIPPDYYLPSDDRWYQVMLDVNTNLTDSVPTIKFFNSPATIYSGGEWNNFQAVASQNAVATPLPAAYTGFFDPISRAALNIRNIALQLSASTSSSDSWTMEAYIQTSKANQYLFTTKKENSFPSQNTGSAIALKNGKITFIASNSTNVETGYETFSGFKDIADGNWHHVIIQYFGATLEAQNRVQVWIDGKLDIQRYGYTPYIPGRVGYNSANINLYSDFNISGFAINSPSIINERDTSLHYFAAIGHEPYLATPATATATFGTGTRAKGNRARALMLYFWPTFNAEVGYYVGQYNNPFAPVGVNDTEGRDVGGDFDYDTFYGLTTYLTQSTQQFFDWDVFPLPVQKFYAGDTYKGDRNPLLKDTVKIGQGPEGTTYIDEVTDNYRYLNLIKDVYELDQYDAIFFRNYPDQSSEQDKQGLNSKTEVDAYFNLQEKELFKEFLDSLREAIDTYGISLFVTNPQLAVDLGIIQAATPVDLMRDAGNFFPDEFSDNRAPVVTGRIDSTGNTLDPVNQYGAGWYDTFFNDRHRVINTLEYLTDDNTFIWTDYAFYKHSDELNYGGADKLYKRYENRPYGLQIGDEFVFADSGNPRFRLPYQAIKPEHLKAGIPITALGATAHLQNFDSYQQGTNPYKDYITTVALPVGTNLNGKLTGGKIFVSFSENVANSFTAEGSQFGTDYTEYHEYDMASNYWVDIAYNAKIIDANTQALYKNNTISDAERGQPPLYDDNALIKQYWSLSGDNIISQAVPITRSLKGFVGGDIGPEVPEQNKKRTRTGLASLPPAAGTRLRDALGRFASGGGSASVTGGNLNTFKILTGRIYDTGTVFIPSINTRGLWWLSDKNIIEGKVVGGVGMSASATIPNPIVTADHPADVTANHMLAQATLVDNTSGTKNNLALPLTATVFMPTLGGKTIVAEKAESFAFMPTIYPLTETDYTVTLYLNHTDPILYIRKEVIK